ncbi:MAG: hypothetical protein IJ189_08160 [Clostridia bacterium]|nr:hypothetical protein [Clostridia bacterium]
MKKFVALMLALVLALTAVAAIAETTKSVTSGDTNKTTTTPAKTTKTTTTTTTTDTAPAFYIMISRSASRVAKANEEIAKLAEAANVAEYFGKAEEIAAILGEGEYKVNELWPVIAANYDESMGDIVATFTFATPYEDGEKVAVLLSVDGEWSVFEGEAKDGAITVTLDAATVEKVVESGALIAIVNK